jgi:TatA/E family protein of Tat protein translocase
VEILGIGPMELILILIVALMVFGPDKLPQIGAKLGRGMRDMRRATRAISEEINTTRAAVEAPARELAEPFKDVADAAKAAGSIAAAARNPGQTLRDSVMRELNPPPKPEPKDEQATGDENTIAPPQLAAQSQVVESSSTTETAAALPEPGASAAALPALEQPIAQLPPPEEPGVSSPAPQESAVAAGEELASSPTEPTDADTGDRPASKTTDPLAPTSPEQ